MFTKKDYTFIMYNLNFYMVYPTRVELVTYRLGENLAFGSKSAEFFKLVEKSTKILLLKFSNNQN